VLVINVVFTLFKIAYCAKRWLLD